MDSHTIRSMFGHIAPNYDKANTIISLGLHSRWNRKLAQSVEGAKHLLDLCAGTGEIAFTFLKSQPASKAVLLDFCKEMLDCAQKKGISFADRFALVEADAEKLPFPNACFDAITVAYGIRNVKRPIQCFQEAFRVLEKGGRFAILELTRPRSSLLKFGHAIYLRFFIPTFGKLITQNKYAYSYLSNSIQSFSDPFFLSNSLKEIGFESVQMQSFLGGVATLIVARK